MAGHEVSIVKKDKKIFGRVESAFLKENTEAYDIKFQTKKTVKVKIELDIDPPLGFETEELLMQQPYTFSTRCLTLPYLYAGKLHALVYRAWRSRVKGRDWYDFEWYVRWRVPLDFKHLQERIHEFTGETVTKDTFMQMLRDKLATTDIESVKADVFGFAVEVGAAAMAEDMAGVARMFEVAATKDAVHDVADAVATVVMAMVRNGSWITK